MMRDSLVNKVQLYRERMLQMVRLEEAAQEEQVCVWMCVCVHMVRLEEASGAGVCV